MIINHLAAIEMLIAKWFTGFFFIAFNAKKSLLNTINHITNLLYMVKQF